MTLVDEVVAYPLHGAEDPAPSQGRVETGKCSGEVYPDQTVEEADGRFPSGDGFR